jgi:hypothetical protein
MAEGTANPLIMALRANTAPSGSMPTGVKNISFPWQTNNTGPLVIPNRPIKPKVTTPTPPPPATTQAVPPPAPKPPMPPFNPNFNPRLSPDGRLPFQDMRIEADAPVTDEMSVRQTLEQIMADPAPQSIEPPTQVAPPQDMNIPAFNSNVDFQMPDTLFQTPAPFVPGFTPQADVAQSMAPVVQEPPALDPNLLAMLGGQPMPATQPVLEEPMYGAQLPAWYFNEFGFDGNR